MPIKNLAKQQISKLGYEERIKLLFQQAKSPYELTIPLLAASILGNDGLYQSAKDKLLPLLQSAEKNSVTAWLLGRMLVAAANIGDSETAQIVEVTMRGILENPKTKADEYTAWAWGYLAIYHAENKQEYLKLKDSMISAADKVDKTNLSNVMWAHVMNLQAAALANDQEGYDAILEKMRADTNQSTIIGAFQHIPITDFRALAVASVALAMEAIRDDQRYQMLKGMSDGFLAEVTGESYGDKANKLLTQLNLELAAARFNMRSLLQQQQSNMSLSYTESN